MTKEAALKQFFSGFGIPAYTTSSVPKNVEFPYITYTTPVSSLRTGPASITVNVWYYTTSESLPNAKAREISDALGYGGKMLKCDEGGIWLMAGSPENEPITSEVSENIKGRYMNITADYLTPT